MPIFISVAQSEISTTNIDVADVDAAREFFTAGLGFSMWRQASESVVLVAVTLEIWLLSRTQNSCATPESSTSRTYKRHWTPIHHDIIVDDLHSALERAIRAGAIREGDIEADQQGSIAFCSDPFGNGFCLIQKCVRYGPSVRLTHLPRTRCAAVHKMAENVLVKSSAADT
jgi:predicted enzyme related to lactoylglutathione lyase